MRIVTLLVFATIASCMAAAQTTMQTQQGIEYRHSDKVSAKARNTNKMLVILGIKKMQNKTVEKGRYKTEASKPRGTIKRKFRLEESSCQGRKLWVVSPKQSEPDVVVLYLHGGAYIHNIIGLHWKLLAALAEETGAIFVIPDYPLAPQYTCSDAFRYLESIVELVTQRYGGKKIVYAGDSAGGGLALALAQYQREQGTGVASQLILLSPWLDVSMTNPEIETLDACDPMLNIGSLKQAGELWAGPLGNMHPLASPIYGSFEGLCPISVFIGTNDLLYADCLRLRNMLRGSNNTLNFFEYPQMFHVWMGATQLPEAKEAIGQIGALIRNGAKPDIE